ncbi:hypothetical protein T265_06041 [Opisthorchis viverrini]|uniref:Uncharacterized protein n=1 Tax=Opisthorchis viverrini TaxID=6198 RepID=A0A074ZHM1_OPIVI|nr:hypothetical protein T265_06041 [Opisthorchis viverrini]KER26758.1 hypothetical protein T265_06041 [Opisthorchis viverrini]
MLASPSKQRKQHTSPLCFSKDYFKGTIESRLCQQMVFSGRAYEWNPLENPNKQTGLLTVDLSKHELELLGVTVTQKLELEYRLITPQTQTSVSTC